MNWIDLQLCMEFVYFFNGYAISQSLALVHHHSSFIPATNRERAPKKI